MNSDELRKTGRQKILVTAFDRAWAKFLQAEKPLGDPNLYRRSLANKIVALSRTGMIDVTDLSECALAHLLMVARNARLLANPPLPRPNDDARRDEPNLAPRIQANPAARLRRRLMQNHG